VENSVSQHVRPTGIEVTFDPADIIVSKTDLRGRITYANEVFCHVAGYSDRELLGQPHSIIRHPDMPRAVFKLLWDMLGRGEEVFAYVKNMAKHGGFYWVFAHVTPSFDAQGKVIAYHSSRRVPDRAVVARTIVPVYAELLRIERSHRNAKEGLAASFAALEQTIARQGVSYDRFVLSLT
jgi:PAS domain S-box-containing protein